MSAATTSGDDLSQLTVEQLLEPFRNLVAERKPAEDWMVARLDELASRIENRTPDNDPFVLPVSLTDRIRELFGPGRQTFLAMEKRCKFALKVWDGKYGPLTPEKHEYAVSLLLWALDARVIQSHPNGRACAYERLGRVVNHERTDDGFKSREGALVDVSQQLGELAA